jgi:hypothetical protein
MVTLFCALQSGRRRIIRWRWSISDPYKRWAEQTTTKVSGIVLCRAIHPISYFPEYSIRIYVQSSWVFHLNLHDQLPAFVSYYMRSTRNASKGRGWIHHGVDDLNLYKGFPVRSNQFGVLQNLVIPTFLLFWLNIYSADESKLGHPILGSNLVGRILSLWEVILTWSTPVFVVLEGV